MDGVVATQIRIPADTYTELKELAYRKRRSVNSLVVQAVEELLLKQEAEGKK